MALRRDSRGRGDSSAGSGGAGQVVEVGAGEGLPLDESLGCPVEDRPRGGQRGGGRAVALLYQSARASMAAANDADGPAPLPPLDYRPAGRCRPAEITEAEWQALAALRRVTEPPARASGHARGRRSSGAMIETVGK